MLGEEAKIQKGCNCAYRPCQVATLPGEDDDLTAFFDAIPFSLLRGTWLKSLRTGMQIR